MKIKQVNTKNKLLAICNVIVLGSCATAYETSTNIDSENFKQYFAPAKVTIYESEQDFSGSYIEVGKAEGEDCQAKAHHASPDVIIARTNARRQAYNQGANAIIFSGCANVTTKQCVNQTICYGRTFKVNIQK